MIKLFLICLVANIVGNYISNRLEKHSYYEKADSAVKNVSTSVSKELKNLEDKSSTEK